MFVTHTKRNFFGQTFCTSHLDFQRANFLRGRFPTLERGREFWRLVMKYSLNLARSLGEAVCRGRLWRPSWDGRKKKKEMVGFRFNLPSSPFLKFIQKIPSHIWTKRWRQKKCQLSQKMSERILSDICEHSMFEGHIHQGEAWYILSPHLNFTHRRQIL